jgi:hypothetical protein
VQRHDYTTRNQKLVDFLLGFFGWYIINLVLFIALALLSGVVSGAVSESLLDAGIDPVTATDAIGIAGLVLQCLVLVANVGTLFYFGFTRYWIALGELAAFAFALLLVLCAALVFGAFCFVMLNQGTGF